MRRSLPSTLLSLLVLLIPCTLADPATIPFQDCFDEPQSIGQKFNVTTVYAQVLHNDNWGEYLNLTVVGTSPRDILGRANGSSSLSTLFTTSSVLTLDTWSNSSYLCQNMRPQSPLPALNSSGGSDGTYCPITTGAFAFSSTIPWGRNRELTTLITRLRAVDPFGKELVCLDIFTTPLDPRPKSPYGKAEIIFWCTVALTMAYWVVVGIARISSAWSRGITGPGRGLWSRTQSAGYILTSALSGEGLAKNNPALLRFGTPSMRDVVFHTQWCAVLAMVGVEWPQFVYPLLTQTAWSTLSYNISLTKSSQSDHWDAFNSTPYSPPSSFASQFADPTSPIFIDPTVPNIIFGLPADATHGISSFAYTIGIRPRDLFPTCMILFLSIVSATIVISVIIWAIDYTICILGESRGVSHGHSNVMNRLAGARSPVFSSSKESGNTLPLTASEENKSSGGPDPGPSSAGVKPPNTRFSLPLAHPRGVSSDRGINSHRSWWRLRSDIAAFHGSALHGNLVRILVLFHLPVTVFSCYEMTSSASVADTGSVVLGALSFAVFSILLPAHLIIRVTPTRKTKKLYEETKTLLSLGPLYNHYRQGSQSFASLFFVTNIAFGVTVGAGQKSGTAQAIIILIIEVASALVTSIWLPWGSGASMGLISFLFCVARIVIAVLLVILTQAISIGPGPGGWVAYGILIILALVYLALVLMLLVKIVEGVIRIFGGIGFQRSRHAVDSGLLGTCNLLGCFGEPRKRGRRRSYKRKPPVPNVSQLQRRDSDLSSYMPPVGGVMIADGTATPPRFMNADSRKGSTHSHPPSVLKPEQANKPYTEESVDTDDEVDIMGAWQRFQRPSTGYSTVGEGSQISPSSFFGQQKAKQSTSSPTNAATPTGFSRVGGGRAHVDTPYAITTGSTHTFPSIGQQSTNHSTSALTGQPFFYEQGMNETNNDIPLEMGLAIGNNGLPPGAMQAAHIRTKSQTAIVEDYLPSVPPSSTSMVAKFQQQQSQIPLGLSSSARQKHLSENTSLRPPDAINATKFTLGAENDDDDDDSGDEADQQKKKPWYHLRRNRAYSVEGRKSTAASTADLGGGGPVDEELGGLGLGSTGTPQTQRSFVVIRKPPGSMGRLSQAGASGSAAASPGRTHPTALTRPPTR